MARGKKRRIAKKIAVIYHNDCLDGFGAAYAAWKKFGSKAEYFPVNHQTTPLPLKNKVIYMLDFIYENERDLRLLQYNNEKVTAIDHHVSTEHLVKSTEDYSYALNHSGATLTWQYFHPQKPTPLLLRYIEDNDIWRLKMPHTHEVMIYLELQPYDFNVWDKLVRDFEKPAFRKSVFENGTLLKSYAKRIIGKIIATAGELVRFKSHTVYAVNSAAWTAWATGIGHALYEKHPPFAIIWWRRGDKIKVSMRGTGKPDLARIAQKYGGGGHKGAAGFSISARKGLPWKIIDE